MPEVRGSPFAAGRVALVTGAARGIGAAVVRRLVAEGYGVVAFDWCAGDDSPAGYAQATPEDLDELVASLPDGSVTPYVGDVRDRDSLGDAVEVALRSWGRLDVAVAGAAVIAGGTPAWDAAASEDLDLLWEVDVRGVWNTAAVAIPAMLAGPAPHECRLVAVASAAGSHGLFRLAAYTTAKHAVVGLVRGLAADLVGTGITAVAVSPGSTATAMLQATADLYGVTTAELAGHQLLRRELDPDEVAATVALCCAVDGAALNGSEVHLDGGFGG